MIKLYDSGAYLVDGKTIVPDNADAAKEIQALTGKDYFQGAGFGKHNGLRNS